MFCMLKLITLKYSFQLILCCLTFDPEYFFITPLGIILFILVEKINARFRYLIGFLLLTSSIEYPIMYPISYGYIQCNTYTSVRSLLQSDLKYELNRIVMFIELFSYLMRSFIGYPCVYLLYILELINLITFFKPPIEEKDIRNMLESVKYLIQDYVLLSKEYRAIFGTLKYNNRILEEHEFSESDFSNEFCNLEKSADMKKHKTNEITTIDFDLFTSLILVNINNVFSFYAIGILLLPTYSMTKMIYFVAFFYILSFELLSLLLIPFSKMNFYNNSIYIRVFTVMIMYYLYKI